MCLSSVRRESLISRYPFDGDEPALNTRWWPKGELNRTSSRRTEIPLPGFQVAGGVVLQFGVIAAQPILPDLTGIRMEVRDQDAGVVASFAPDNLRACQRIDAAQAGADRQWAVDPSRFQVVVVRTRQIRTDQSGRAPQRVKTHGFGRVVVNTAVERIQVPPLGVNGSRCNAGHCCFGARCPAPYQNRINTAGVEPSKDVG